MFTAASNVVAGVAVALLGGVLISGATSPDTTVRSAAASLTPTAESATAATSSEGAIVMDAPAARPSVAGPRSGGRRSSMRTA